MYIKLNHRDHKAYGGTMEGAMVPFDEHYSVVYVTREMLLRNIPKQFKQHKEESHEAVAR